jgi:hypothetical protein
MIAVRVFPSADLIVVRVSGWLVLLGRSEASKDAEIMVLHLVGVTARPTGAWGRSRPATSQWTWGTASAHCGS